MADKVCAFCGQKLDTPLCRNCGGNAVNKEPKKEEHWQQPFLHNGYIVWAVTDDLWRYDVITYHFFLGETLVETISITRDILKEFVPEGESHLTFLWKLLEVSQGREEVLRVQTMNSRRPAEFEFRRVETDEEKETTRLRSLPEGELMQEIYQAQEGR